jgi:hypothetical protein
MKFFKVLTLTFLFSAGGCSLLESATCQIGGWEPHEIEECNFGGKHD